MTDDVRTGILNQIYVIDPAIYARVLNDPIDKLTTYLDKLRTVERSPFDKAPMLTFNVKGGRPDGIVNSFNEAYNSFESDLESGTLRMVGTDVFCEIEVIRVLKTILKIGVGRDVDKATACRDLAARVFNLAMTNNFITTRMMLDAMAEVDGDVAKLIYKTAKERVAGKR